MQAEIKRLCEEIAASPRLWSHLDRDAKTDGDLQAALIIQLKVFLLDDSRTIAGWTKVQILVALLDNEDWHDILGHEFMVRLHARALHLNGSPDWNPRQDCIAEDDSIHALGEVHNDDEAEEDAPLVQGPTEQEPEFNFDATARSLCDQFRWVQDSTADDGEDDDASIAPDERVEVLKYKAVDQGSGSTTRKKLCASLTVNEATGLLKVLDLENQEHKNALVRFDEAVGRDGKDSPDADAARRDLRRILELVCRETCAFSSRARVALCVRHSSPTPRLLRSLKYVNCARIFQRPG